MTSISNGKVQLKKQKIIQYSITFGALIVVAFHLIWPTLSIDGIVAVFILIALIPWVSPLFKSLELPRGIKFEFQDLQKVEKQAKKAGLIKEETVQQKAIDYSFLSVAKTDPNLALAGLRIEIEKRLRRLAEENNIDSSKKGLRALMTDLSNNQLLTLEERSALADMTTTLNEAAHGELYDLRAVKWVIENGPKILASLDGKLDKHVEVKTSSSPYNMDAWGYEKSEQVLSSLSQLVDTIKSEFSNKPELRDKLFEYIAPSIWDASKLYAFFNDTEWQTEDRDFIMREGFKGFEKVKHRYNRV